MRGKILNAKALGLILLLAGFFAIDPSAANPQRPRCGPRTAMVEWLDNQFDEKRSGVGISREGRLIEVFTSGAGSWTVLMTFPVGQLA